MVNQYIANLSLELRNFYYSIFGFPMYLTMFALYIWGIRIHAIKWKNAIILFLAYIITIFINPEVCTLLDTVTDGLIPNRNMGVGFLTFLLIFVLLNWICKNSIVTALDVAVPMYIGGRGITIIGCIFPGCCHGKLASWGIYSHQANGITIPCPIIDSVTSLLIVVIGMVYARRNPKGITAAYSLIAFGILRYVIDLLRDNDKLFDLITMEGIFGFLYICIGLSMLYVLQKRNLSTSK